MAVRIVTDSSAGLPPAVVAELDITVLDLHVIDAQDQEGAVEHSTSGLTALELAAAYGRQAQLSVTVRDGEPVEDGVLAIHLSRALSSTWSAAVSASGVFPDTVRVLDSTTAGMVQGAAAMAAAQLALEGASLDECYEIAAQVVARGRSWVYINSTDELRKSGRLSTAAVVLSTALLATKPIVAIRDGKLDIVGKTRTQTKAFTKLVELVQERAQGEPCFVAIQHHAAAETTVAAGRLQELLEAALPAGSTFMQVPLNEVVAVHTGPGAIGVSAVFSQDEPADAPARQPLFGPKRQSES